LEDGVLFAVGIGRSLCPVARCMIDDAKRAFNEVFQKSVAARKGTFSGHM
jgi:hypothetical protein